MELLIALGYPGMFISAFLAATIIPFSSDVVLVALIAAGLDPVILIILATVGNWLGGLLSYYMGYLGRWEWLERYMNVKREKIEKQRERVEKWGSFLAFFSWLPAIGDLLAIALGFYKVDFKKMALWMFVGKGLRFVAWALLYFWVAK